jgi:hypothetical protein
MTKLSINRVSIIKIKSQTLSFSLLISSLAMLSRPIQSSIPENEPKRKRKVNNNRIGLIYT